MDLLVSSFSFWLIYKRQSNIESLTIINAKEAEIVRLLFLVWLQLQKRLYISLPVCEMSACFFEAPQPQFVTLSVMNWENPGAGSFLTLNKTPP